MSDSSLARRVMLQVTFSGEDISGAVSRDLSSFCYTDNEEDEADDLQIALNDRDGNWLQKWLDPTISEAASSSNDGSKGLKIAAAIVRRNWKSNGNDEILECGTFELDSVTVSGPPSKVTMKGTSIPYSSSIRQEVKSKSWENVSLSQIAETIAVQGGLAVMFTSKHNPQYSRVEQYQQSDIVFLSFLCHNVGASLKTTNDIIVIFDQEEFEKKDAVRTIKFGKEGGYSKFNLLTNENDRYTSCRVYYTQPDGSVISATAQSETHKADGKNKQCLEVRQNVSSIAEAQALAEKMLRLHNKYEYEATFTFPGDTSLVAGNTVELKDFGAWNGKYVIKQAKHNVTSSGYTTQISLRKALAPASESGETDGGMTDEELDELANRIIRGEFANAPERWDNLAAAGYDEDIQDAAQKRVNEKLGYK